MKEFSRDTLADQLAQELLSMVISGSLLPGQVLPSEGELSSTFRVSRSVVREGLSHLKAMGVLELTNGKKAVVKVPDHVPLMRFFTVAAAQQADDMVQLREARCGIESECAVLAAERRTEEDMQEIETLLGKMAAIIGTRGAFDTAHYAELDRDFHLAVARASKNFFLERLALSIREPMKQGILDGLNHQHSKAQRRAMQADHRKIAEAIRGGRSEEARAVVRWHIMVDARRAALDRRSSTDGPHAPDETGRPIQQRDDRPTPCSGVGPDHSHRNE
ncbi:MAG TPA: FadR/GntR family transcriptional regulator [Acidimicrobiales bacterium]|nr:FadR/GntR family transcriptional regulator [Acidimicrobiales bacterium]